MTTSELKTRLGHTVLKHSMIAPAASRAARDAYAQRIREHWTPERMARATPIDPPDDAPEDDDAADDG